MIVLSSAMIASACSSLTPEKKGIYTMEALEKAFSLTPANPKNYDKILISLDDVGNPILFFSGLKPEFSSLPLSQEYQHDSWKEKGGKSFDALLISNLPNPIEHLMEPLIIRLAAELQKETKILSGKEFTTIIADVLSTQLTSSGMMDPSTRKGLFGELILLRRLLKISKPKDYSSV